jgi:foldase protein PrsA
VTKTNRRSPLVAVVIVGLVALSSAALLGLAGCGGSDSADLPAGVVAQVGDAQITQAQLTEAIDQARFDAKAQGQPIPAAGAEGYTAVEQSLLDQLVRSKVIELEADKCGKPCVVTPKQIDAELASLRKSNFEDSQAKFDAYLKERGISKADARSIVKLNLQQTALVNHVTRGIRFTAADAKKYYEDNPAQFKVAAGRTASHILVPTEAEADKIRAEATTDNFAELAKEYSTDTGSKSQGGSLGQIQKGQLVPAFEKVAFSLKSGEISAPVKTQFGWHIITVTTTPARTTPFSEAEPQIISSQLAAKRQAAFTEWSEKALKDWEKRTVYANDDLKPASTTAPATTAPPG